ncbi:protein-tyrosine phosphatase-like protein, partial [Dunaliella salina]
ASSAVFLCAYWDALRSVISWDIIAQHGITHVINCVGFICKEYFPGELQYLTYYLQGCIAQGVSHSIAQGCYAAQGVLHRITRGVSHLAGHTCACVQGVSRSATIVIAYMMWKMRKSYDEAYTHVKAARGVANPNIGFTCQLLQWQKRCNAPPARMRMYRMAPHCQHAPLLLVPRLITPPKDYVTHTWRALDPRGAFVIQAPNCQYVWIGARCAPAFAAAAEATACLLPKYEATSSSTMELQYQAASCKRTTSIPPRRARQEAQGPHCKLATSTERQGSWAAAPGQGFGVHSAATHISRL